jgi:sigma-E factor negative regulatory protein RseA
MKEKISILMDGELGEREFEEAFSALARDDEAMRAWRAYHVIRDVLHGEDVLAKNLSSGVAARLAQEPTVLAPQRAKNPLVRRQWMAFSAAASVAAVALVGWLAFAPQLLPSAGPAGPLVANAPSAVPDSLPRQSLQAPVDRVPLPKSTDDYLLAHQGYSPRLTLQGVAPYIRTVSDEAVASDNQ